jgi:hypothetical protein
MDVLTDAARLLYIKNVFLRERTSIEIRALGILLICPDLSLRQTREMLRWFGDRVPQDGQTLVP